jgi:ribosomal-protein-alanine N-acetyltransferase
MEEKDLDQVCALEKKIFTQPWERVDFQASLDNPTHIYVVAEENGEIVGYSGLWMVANEGQIYNVAVREDFRKKGVGYAMLSHLLELAKEQNQTSFTLEVRASNEAAIRLYGKLGFKSSGIREDFYKHPREDANIMWLL